MFGALSCRKYMSWAVRYLTGDLEPETRRAEFERHITQCERCRIVVAERRQQLQELLNGTTAPQDLKETLEEMGIRPSGARWAGWVMAGALVVVLFATAYVWRLANPLDSFLGPKASNVLTAGPPKSTPPALHLDETKGGGLVDAPKKPAPKTPKVKLAPPTPVPKPAKLKVVRPVKRHIAHRVIRVHHRQWVRPRPHKTSEVEVLGPRGSVVGHSGKTVSRKER